MADIGSRCRRRRSTSWVTPEDSAIRSWERGSIRRSKAAGLPGETTHDCLAGTARHQEYYQRLEASVLADTRVTHRIGRAVYRDVGKAMTILENPMVWRPVVQGNADGATFTEIIRKSGWFLLKSLAFRSVRSRREGASLPGSLGGPLRGLKFVVTARPR